MEQGNDKKIMNLLTGFIVTQIDQKVLQGISYIIVSKTPANKEKIAKFDALRAELTELGVPVTEQFKVYDVNTAKIYEVDLGTAITITEQLAKAVGDTSGNLSSYSISTTANQRRNDDIDRLVSYCVKQAKNGKSQSDIALFSKNTVDHINISGKTSKGQSVVLTYDAFALRHTDITDVNKKLADSGIQISNILIHEALPSMTGVRTTITLVALQ